MTGVPAFKLVEAGFSQPQVEALAEFMQTEAARRSDLMEVRTDLKADVASVRSEVLLLKWMIGFALALLVGIFGKLFLH
jgi:hypothetical protein